MSASSPRSTCLQMVPPAQISASSGWAMIAVNRKYHPSAPRSSARLQGAGGCDAPDWYEASARWSSVRLQTPQLVGQHTRHQAEIHWPGISEHDGWIAQVQAVQRFGNF